VKVKELDGLIAEKFEAIATFDERDALGRQALKFDRSHFGAILFALAFALRLFVVVELTIDSGCRTVEEVDGRPEQILEVRFKPGLVQRGDKCVEDVGHCASNHPPFGQRSRIGLLLEWTVAKQLQFAKDMVGRRCRERWLDVVMIGHGMRSFARLAASIAAFVAITETAGAAGQQPEQRAGPKRQRRMAEVVAILIRDAKRAFDPSTAVISSTARGGK
jgi:hypothetical protein